MPNAVEPREPAQFLVPMQRVEDEAGLELMPALPDEERRRLESQAAKALW